MQRTMLHPTPRATRGLLRLAAALLGGVLAACESTTPPPTSPSMKGLTGNADIIGLPGCNVGYCRVPPRILFTSMRDANPEIYSMKYDGSEVKRLTFSPATDNFASWSPDYSKIAFVSTRNFNTFQIYTMNADGTNVKQLTNAGMNTLPRWSPDGTKIAFSRTYDQVRYQTYTMNADGTGQALIRPTAYPVSEGQVSWSPDGTRIAFKSDIANPWNGEFDIWTSKPDGTDAVRVTTTLRASRPAFSPDGSQILFLTDQYGTIPKGIYVVSASGGGVPKLVTTSAREDDYPTWRPDGKRIAFMSTRAWGSVPGGHWSIFTVNLDGTFLNRPSGSIFIDDTSPSWSFN